MKIVLVLGCWGRKDNGFVSCKGVTNNILDLTKSSERNRSIKDYLDRCYQLFDKPLYNNVHTAIYNINEKFSTVVDKVFPDTLYQHMEAFCLDHKRCGTFLRLEIIEKE